MSYLFELCGQFVKCFFHDTYLLYKIERYLEAYKPDYRDNENQESRIASHAGILSDEKCQELCRLGKRKKHLKEDGGHDGKSPYTQRWILIEGYVPSKVKKYWLLHLIYNHKKENC